MHDSRCTCNGCSEGVDYAALAEERAYAVEQALTMDVKALIFANGQQDQFGRVWPLAVFGRNPKGYVVTIARNVYPSLTAVAAVVTANVWNGFTHITVSGDSCG